MTGALFISDVHLKDPEEPNYRLLLDLLTYCQKRRISHLFWVGDIFDFWIADRAYLLSAHATLIAKVRDLIREGIEVHYFEGNHDLDLARFWQRQLGVHVHAGPCSFMIGNLKVRVEHGDQTDPSDRGYLFLRWLLRTRLLVFLGRHLPEAVVRWIGRRASATSRDYTRTVKTVSEDAAREKIRRHAHKSVESDPFDVIVTGHVHVKEDSQQTAGRTTFRCINLGTWLREPLALEIRENAVSIARVTDLTARI